MNCGFCGRQIKRTGTGDANFGPMHIHCWHRANDRGLLAEQVTNRFKMGDEFEAGVHGSTPGKRYRFRGDCVDCAVEATEHQTRGCQVRYGFNVFEAYVAKLCWSAILVEYPLDKDLFYALRWELQ